MCCSDLLKVWTPALFQLALGGELGRVLPSSSLKSIKTVEVIFLISEKQIEVLCLLALTTAS